jgi:tetratricopeptide (TPR) repeat protein
VTRLLRSPIVSGVAAAAAIVILFATAVWLETIRDRRYQLESSDEETLYLTQRATGRIVFTQRPLAADLYWIRAIQYYGGHTKDAKTRIDDALAPPPALAAKAPISFGNLYPLLDIATTLDPRFNIAYRFGAIFLSEHYPHGPGRPDQAIALLEKGLGVMPDKWQYWQDIGFVYYWDVHDYRKAADAFQRGAAIAGAPWWLKSLAATTLAKGGDRGASRLLWQQLYQTSNNDFARTAARTKLQQLDAIEAIERLQGAVDALSARSGSQVSDWNALIRSGAIPGIPLDPVGVPYELSSSSRVELSSHSPLFPLPIEPGSRSGV